MDAELTGTEGSCGRQVVRRQCLGVAEESVLGFHGVRQSREQMGLPQACRLVGGRRREDKCPWLHASLAFPPSLGLSNALGVIV